MTFPSWQGLQSLTMNLEVTRKLASLLATASLVASPSLVHGHGTAHDAHAAPGSTTVSKQLYDWGRQGEPGKVSRTVQVDMSDSMRFSPAHLDVRRGETIRFVVHNEGKLMHEMVIGNAALLKAHADMMRKHPGMEHDEPYMAHVAPGKSQEILWTFTSPGEFMYGCLVAGHLEAGMQGHITVKETR